MLTAATHLPADNQFDALAYRITQLMGIDDAQLSHQPISWLNHFSSLFMDWLCFQGIRAPYSQIKWILGNDCTAIVIIVSNGKPYCLILRLPESYILQDEGYIGCYRVDSYTADHLVQLTDGPFSFTSVQTIAKEILN
jgi:hypothetical protein